MEDKEKAKMIWRYFDCLRIERELTKEEFIKATRGAGSCKYCAFIATDMEQFIQHRQIEHFVLLKCEDCGIVLDPNFMKLHKELNCDQA